MVFLKSPTGRYNLAYNAGDEIDPASLDDLLLKDMIDHGYIADEPVPVKTKTKTKKT